MQRFAEFAAQRVGLASACNVGFDADMGRVTTRDPDVSSVAVLRVARKNGPITVLPEKTRIAFQVRMSFAAFVIRRNWVDGHVVLARRFENPRFRRIETFSSRNHLHAFRFESVDNVDTEVSSWLAEAYQVGEQRHLV